MAQISPFLRSAQNNGLLFWCAGCGEAHQIRYGLGDGPRWQWNENAYKPVVTPSVLVTGFQWPTDQEADDILLGLEVPRRPLVCHSFIGCNGAQPGEIIYLADCTHSLANKVVPLSVWPPHAN